MYTRRGDTGNTDTGRGERISKGSFLIDVQGDLDELGSFVGVAMATTTWDDIRSGLEQVQRDLFTIGEQITSNGKRRTISEERLKWLEERIDEYSKEFGKVTLFVLQGGSAQSASLHVTRTVCRRTERDITRAEIGKNYTTLIPSYINRLSSYFFFLALVSNKRLGVEEKIWPLKYP